MRPIRRGVILGVALALVAGATAANALWSVRAPVAVSATSTGDITVAAVWRDGTPAWGPLFPGRSTAGNVLRITEGGAATTLRWTLRVSLTTASSFSPYVTMQAWVGPCGTGAPIPSTGYTTSGGLIPGQVLDVCVRLTMAANTPASLAGTAVAPVVTVAAIQRGT